MNVGNLLIDYNVGVISEVSSHRILPYKNQFWNSITFELSRTQIEYTRVVYSSLDFLGDIGGLYGALLPFFSFCILMLQYRGAYMFIMSDMLKRPSNLQRRNDDQIKRYKEGRGASSGGNRGYSQPV